MFSKFHSFLKSSNDIYIPTYCDSGNFEVDIVIQNNSHLVIINVINVMFYFTGP